MSFNLRNIIYGMCCVGIFWDMFTTYFGTIAVFNYENNTGTFFSRLFDAPVFHHIVGILLALILATIVFSYKAIWRSGSPVTKPILVVVFIYDFATSFYGTLKASDKDISDIGVVLILIVLAIATTASPLVLAQNMDDE